MHSIASVDNLKSDHVFAADQRAPEIRVDRVLMIRRQLGEGRYCVAEKLNVVMDRLLEDLLQHNCSEGDSQG
jgi:hypothetical protein